ncbi:MAG TPA: hypothetical protein PKJ68_04490 [Candidatus Woesebacteria bacterium]|nr:hypothetical protein [Candidatus Woesebacteria bacterium]
MKDKTITKTDKLEQTESTPNTQMEAWYKLNDKERLAITCLVLNPLVSDAGRDFTARTKLTERMWWKYYSRVKDIWQEVAQLAPAQTLTMLKVASMDAAKELHSQLADRKTENRNKAANDILDKVLPKDTKESNTTPIQVNTYIQNEKNTYGI